MNIETATRTELEGVIVSEDSLYDCFDEQRLLSNGYTTEELRDITRGWIEAGDECGEAL